MAHQRGHSTSDAKEPHSVSLKVLRLSRPSLSIQHPLPEPSSLTEAPPVASSHAYPSSNGTDAFILAPLLTLPQSFGSAYVGETFSCTLCANNEPPLTSTPSKTISNVRIEAEMKIPSSGTPIPLVLGPDTHSSGENKEAGKGIELAPADSLQRIVNFDLKEEGSHVLAVTVTYSETTPTSGRVRSFRKLYQFVCKGCMVVRTKTGAFPSSPVSSKGGRSGPQRWALEAQLENTGEETITLDTVVLETRDGFKSTGLNWDPEEGKPVLMRGDVQQVCFIVERDGELGKVEPDGRLIFGILSLGWRGQMGNRGFLSTGDLGAKIK